MLDVLMFDVLMQVHARSDAQRGTEDNQDTKASMRRLT